MEGTESCGKLHGNGTLFNTGHNEDSRCIGSTLEIREKGFDDAILARQITEVAAISAFVLDEAQRDPAI